MSNGLARTFRTNSRTTSSEPDSPFFGIDAPLNDLLVPPHARAFLMQVTVWARLPVPLAGTNRLATPAAATLRQLAFLRLLGVHVHQLFLWPLTLAAGGCPPD